MPSVTITAKENNSLTVEVAGKTVAALCRCGKSENKPNCNETCKDRIQGRII